jgi:hypothetical protein
MNLCSFAAICVLLAAQSAWADCNIISVSRVQATRSFGGDVTSYGQSQGASPYDDKVINQQINSVSGFNVGGNILSPSLMSINSHTTSSFEEGLMYFYYGYYTNDVVTIQFSVAQPQPFSLSGDPTGAPFSSVSLTGPGVSLSPPNGVTYDLTGTLGIGTYMLSADWGYDTDPGSIPPLNVIPYDDRDYLVLTVPEPSILASGTGAIAMILRRRSRSI